MLLSIDQGTSATKAIVVDPSGAIVARAETVDRQESVAFKPTATGTYTLRVSSYSGGGAYVLDASGGFGAAPAPAPAPAPQKPAVSQEPKELEHEVMIIRGTKAETVTFRVPAPKK